LARALLNPRFLISYQRANAAMRSQRSGTGPTMFTAPPLLFAILTEVTASVPAVEAGLGLVAPVGVSDSCEYPAAALLQRDAKRRPNVSVGHSVPLTGQASPFVQRPHFSSRSVMPIGFTLNEGTSMQFNLATVVPITQDGYEEVMTKRQHGELSIFVRRVLRKLGLRVSRQTGLETFLRFIARKRLSFRAMMKRLTREAGGPDAWALPEVAEGAPDSASAGPHMLELGDTAPLSQEGYADIATSADEIQMKRFIKRAAKNLGYYIIDEKALDSEASRYIVHASQKSFLTLERELRMAARVSRWISVTDSPRHGRVMVNVAVFVIAIAAIVAVCPCVWGTSGDLWKKPICKLCVPRRNTFRPAPMLKTSACLADESGLPPYSTSGP